MRDFLINIFIVVLTVLVVGHGVHFLQLEQRLDKLEEPKPIAKQVAKPVNTFGELNDIKPEHRALIVAIAMTESSCRNDVNHKDEVTVGIGGIKKDIWDLKSNINSLKAIEEIIIILEQRGMKPYEIIKFYKGAKTNLRSTNQCFDIYKQLKRIL